MSCMPYLRTGASTYLVDVEMPFSRYVISTQSATCAILEAHCDIAVAMCLAWYQG